MKLTIENVMSEFPKVRKGNPPMPSAVEEIFDKPTFEQKLKFYGKNAVITEMLDKWLAKANEVLAQRKSDEEAEQKKGTENPKKPKAKFKVGEKVTTDNDNIVRIIKEKKLNAHNNWEYILDTTSGLWAEWQLKKVVSKKQKKVFTGEYVEALSEETKYIRRYIRLNGKSVASAKEDARRILASLQKAIVEKRIRKTSSYAKEIMNIQKSLISIISERSSKTIEIEHIDEYKRIIESTAVMENAKIIKKYLTFEGKSPKKKDVENLIARIDKTKDDEYKEEIETIKTSLQSYIDGSTATVNANEQTLRGLYGIVGSEMPQPKIESGIALNSTEFMGKHFTPMNFSGEWRELIGNPTEPFKMMIYGKAGSGKSTLALRFAKYLACNLKKKVLFVAKEEGFSYTLQEKLNRLHASDSNLFVVDELPKTITKYDFIFIDSVNSAGLEPERLRKIGDGKSFVYIFQTTKDGKFRGENTYGHDVDAIIRVDNKKAQSEKNRFGGNGIISVM